jgi:hypothetical protein
LSLVGGHFEIDSDVYWCRHAPTDGGLGGYAGFDRRFGIELIFPPPLAQPKASKIGAASKKLF